MWFFSLLPLLVERCFSTLSLLFISFDGRLHFQSKGRGLRISVLRYFGGVQERFLRSERLGKVNDFGIDVRW